MALGLFRLGALGSGASSRARLTPAPMWMVPISVLMVALGSMDSHCRMVMEPFSVLAVNVAETRAFNVDVVADDTARNFAAEADDTVVRVDAASPSQYVVCRPSYLSVL